MTTSNQLKLTWLLVSILFSVSVCAETGRNLGEAISNGVPSLQLRLGFEFSSTNDKFSPGKGLNLRTRFGYKTGDYYEMNGFIQFQSQANLLEEFRHSQGGQLNRDTIEDPDGERIHQGFIEYRGISSLKLKIGRQEVILDDARLIGNIDWRQNGQSFDGVVLISQPIAEMFVRTAIVNQANTPSISHTDLQHLILLNAKYVHQETHNFILFTYLLDDKIDTRDSATFGARIDGLCGEILEYGFTYALQEDYKGSKNHNGDLLSVYGGIILKNLNFGIGYERISGKDGKDMPFDTLFGTAHKFNGWADRFAKTNGGNLEGGLEDFYFQFETKAVSTKFLMRYHLFDTIEEEPGIYNGRYGDELDISLTRELDKNLTVQLKAAFYNQVSTNRGINPTTDTEIFWARLNYNF